MTGSKSADPGNGNYSVCLYLNRCSCDMLCPQYILVNLFLRTSFALFVAEEYIALDDNKYIGDLLAEFKSVKDRSKGEILHCKLSFKKRLFRESDDAIADPMFVQLSYVQVN